MNEKETFRSFKMAVVIKCCQYLTNQKCLVLIFSVLLESTSSEQVPVVGGQIRNLPGPCSGNEFLQKVRSPGGNVAV